MPSDRRRLNILTITLSLTAGLPGLALAADIFDRGPAGPERLNTQVAWQISLPSSSVASYQSYHLLDARLYAMATDGTVVAVRADTGEIAWIRKVAAEGDTLWPPVLYQTKAKDLVVFSRLNDVVGLDAKTGVPLHTLPLAKPAVARPTVAPNRCFVAQANGRLAAYRLSDGYVFWRAAFDDQFVTPPAYVEAINAVVAVDEVGVLAALRNDRGDDENRQVIFQKNLRSNPAGELAVDGDMLYLATQNQTLHAVHMGREADNDGGEIAWQYRLAKAPQGGPLLTETAIYQATVGGGLHRIAKNQGEFKNWYDPQAAQFLAEWPQGVVVLRTDGSLALIGDDPARPLAVGSAGGFDRGVPNTRNDAIFLFNSQGNLRCLRPAMAPPLPASAFLAKSADKLPAEPDEPTAISRLREAAQKKRDKLAGRTPEREPVVPAHPAQTKAGDKTQQPTSAPAEPNDPLRSKRPVVR